MTPRIYILDTSFLIELYGLTKRSKPPRVAEAQARFKSARLLRNGLQVPFACVLEFGNKISQVEDPLARVRHAAHLASDFQAGTNRGHEAMWVATDAPQFESATALILEWSSVHAPIGRSLVDAAVVRAASARKFFDKAAQVHIWTYDQKLKAMEPDPDPEPFASA